MNLRKSLHGAAVATLLTILGAAFPARAAEHFSWVDLVSDIHGVSHNNDLNLVNPWGLVPGPDGHGIFVANNGTGTATHYDFLGDPTPAGAPLVITIPLSTGNIGATGNPTGVALNHISFDPVKGANSFVITKNSVSEPAHLIFCSEDGMISGFNETLDATNAIKIFDNSPGGAIYKGLALSFDGAGQQRLYVANFQSGKIEVYKSDLSGDTAVAATINSSDPNAVAGYVPFNIKHFAAANAQTKTIDRFLIVAYANKPNAADHDETAGPGLGYVNVFKADGTFVARLVNLGPDAQHPNDLNAPWGMAVGRHAFGKFGNVLFVGNFGDGKIHRYSLAAFAGTAVGALKDLHGVELQFDGLWALHFAPKPKPLKMLALDSDELDELNAALFFSAGIADESHGLVGVIVPH